MKTFFFSRWVALPCTVLISLVAIAAFAADDEGELLKRVCSAFLNRQLSTYEQNRHTIRLKEVRITV